jgi:hypothetical protein
MPKRIMFLLMLLALALAACQGAGTVAEPTETVALAETQEVSGSVEGNTATPTDAQASPPTDTPLAEVEATPSEVPGEELVTASEGCTVTSPRPTPSPELETLFSPDPDEDWIQGPQDAAVTFLEYGDYQ